MQKTLYIIPLVFFLAFTSLFLSHSQKISPTSYQIEVLTQQLPETTTIAPTGKPVAITSVVDSTSETESSIFNINTATASQLESLPGIGPKKSQAILDYIKANAPISDLNQLLNVKGIGEKTLEKILPFLTV